MDYNNLIEELLRKPVCMMTGEEYLELTHFALANAQNTASYPSQGGVRKPWACTPWRWNSAAPTLPFTHLCARRVRKTMDGTNLDVALYSYRGGTRVDIILATPENDLYDVPFDSRVGQDGMSEVATFAKSRTASPNSRLGSVLAKTIHLADFVMARYASSRGGSWSGKSDLSDTEKQALSDAGRSGTLNATLVDTRYVEHIG